MRYVLASLRLSAVTVILIVCCAAYSEWIVSPIRATLPYRPLALWELMYAVPSSASMLLSWIGDLYELVLRAVLFVPAGLMFYLLPAHYRLFTVLVTSILVFRLDRGYFPVTETYCGCLVTPNLWMELPGQLSEVLALPLALFILSAVTRFARARMERFRVNSTEESVESCQ